MKFGVDISTYQSSVNYKKAVTEGKVEFVIIRAGYGRELNQKDNEFEKHYKGFNEQGIPIGAYQYSYAKDVAGAKAEAEVMLKWIKGKNFNLPVFYDMEESSTAKMGKSVCTEMALAWCDIIRKAGYVAGVYANTNWFNNYLDAKKIGESNIIWCAQWSTSSPNISGVDVWQFGGSVNFIRSTNVPGFSGAVDQNYLVNESILNGVREEPKKAEKTVDELAREVIDGKWGNGAERRERLTKAGYNYNAVQDRVNEIFNRKSVDTLAYEVIRGEWGNGAERKQKLTAAGYDYDKIQERVNQLMG